MKNKLSKIMGIGFALVLVASMMLFAIPAAAGPYDDLVPVPSNAWLEFEPTAGAFGLWFYSSTITQVGPMARAINGDIYAYVANATSPTGPATPNNPGGNDVFKSSDNGRTWSVSQVPFYYFNTNTSAPGGAVVDMVCSSVSEDVLYLTDGNYVFKSINGGMSFALVVPADLEKKLCGACGIAITGEPITSIDLGYDGSGLPITLIGTRYVTGHFQQDGDPAVGTVLWISDETFSAEWMDLQVECFGCCPQTVPTEDTGVANNGALPIGGTLTFPPLLPGTITLTDAVPDETFTDPDGDGVLTGDHGGAGTIDYSTGAWTITSFGAGVTPGGANILATYDSAYGCYDVYSVAAAPGFDNVPKVYAVVTAPLMSINFALNTAAVVTVRAGDQGATMNFTDPDGLGAEIDYEGGALPATDTLTDNEVVVFTVDSVHAAGSVNVKVTDGTVSWRVVTLPTLGVPAATFCGGTSVISTLTVCSWNQVTELKWDCRWSYTIQHATRMMFPSYYATEPTLFVGTVAVEDFDEAGTDDWWGEGGDVYRVADTIPASGCIDLNVQGFTTGCEGIRHANICSLDIDDADGLLAGAWDEYQLQSPTRVYYSADGGWTWAPSKKDPTGTDRTYVLFGSAVAGTRGCDCAFSMSCGDNIGEYFNQISLIDMEIDEVLDLTHSPDYVTDSSTMYVLTNDLDSCHANQDLRSLLRWDGTYWERVHSSRFFYPLTTQDNSDFVNFPLYDWVEVSPDFNSTSVVYMANTEFYLARTIDAGCSWAPLTYPCFDRPAISAWIVVDEDTVLTAGGGDYAGNIYRTTNHGAQPWSEFTVLNTVGVPACNGVDFDLSLPRAADSDVLFGDACGQVYLSSDLGETWAEIQDALTYGFNDEASPVQTYVVFDPGYAVADDPGESVIYAAAGTDIGRCAVDLVNALPFKQDWLYLSTATGDCLPCSLCVASGIDAAGDTVLYVSDAGVGGSVNPITASGTIEIDCACGDLVCGCDADFAVSTDTVTTISGTFIDGELLEIVAFDGTCSRVWVPANGEAAHCACTITADVGIRGFESGAYGTLDVSSTTTLTDAACDTEGECTTCSGANAVALSNFLTVTVPTGGLTFCDTGVWRTVDALATINEVTGANYVEFEFLSTGPTVPNSLLHPAATEPAGYTAFTVYPDDLWLTWGSNVLWALDDVPGDSPTYDIWMWDDPLATQVVQLLPADGALLATTTTATLEWEALDGAEYYEVYIYSYCPTCPENMVLFDNFTSEYLQTCVVIEGLTPGEKYYWEVRVACGSPKVSKWSDLRTFDTALGAVPYLCSPICGSDGILLTTNYSWDAVVGATSYDLQVVAASADGTVDWTDATTYTSAENAFASIPGLEYSTVYYWRVRASNDGVYSAWAVCLFTTADEPAEVVDPGPAVVVEQNEITPTWIWVIIGIGGALTIAVVILIVTTRRVP